MDKSLETPHHSLAPTLSSLLHLTLLRVFGCKVSVHVLKEALEYDV